MKNIKLYITVFVLSFAYTGCYDTLEVENINNPDREDVLTDPDGIIGLTAGLFNTWFIQEQHNFGSPGPALWVMSDWGTVTFANYATRDMSEEPRIFMDNSPSYGYHSTIRNFWQKMYAIVTTANDVVFAVDSGLDIGDNGEDNMMIKGMGYFMQGLGNGYIGLLYDKAYPSDENTDYGTLEVTDYQASIELAITQLKKAIVVFDNNSFNIPADWMNGNSFSNTEMSQLAHSFIARLMVYSPRNEAETNALDWNAILMHAQNGITQDFNIEGDGNGGSRKWMSWYKYYMARPNWGKVDMRVVNVLDNTIPPNWPEGGIGGLPHDGRIISSDLRVLSDFQYNTANNRPERGLYRWSTYRYSRLDSYFNANFFAPVIMMRAAEIDLFEAEALLRLGRLSEAAAIINSGSRVMRGNLPNVAVDETAIRDAISYERTIELPLTGMGIEYFDMRRNDRLQDGSLLHFPIPAQQLETIQEPFYTYGGLNPQFGVPGQDVAIDGWYRP